MLPYDSPISRGLLLGSVFCSVGLFMAVQHCLIPETNENLPGLGSAVALNLGNNGRLAGTESLAQSLRLFRGSSDAVRFPFSVERLRFVDRFTARRFSCCRLGRC